MKGLLGLTCLCWLLASVGLSVQTLPEVAGHSFSYQLELQTLVGIPELANQYSGLSLLGKLKIDAVSKNKAVLTIQNVRVGKINEEVPVSYEDDIEFTHTPSPHYERELSKPVVIHFSEHEVEWLEAQKSDPIWSVNIKKAIAEKFQVDLKRKSSPAFRAGSNQVPRIDPSAPVFSVYEDGIGGECETRYTIQSIQSLDHPDQSEDVLNVTKTKNYRNCRSRAVFDTDNYDEQGCSLPCEPKYSPETRTDSGIWRESSSVYESGCHFGFEPDHHPVKSYAIVGYNISSASHNPLIEGIIAKGKTAYNLFGREILVASEMNLTLVKKTGLRSDVPKIQHPVKYDSLEYQLPEVQKLSDNLLAILGDFHTGEVVRAFLRMLEDMVNDIIPTEPETSQAVGTKVVQLVNALSVLSRPELEEIFQELETDKVQKVPKKEEMMRKVFLDVLAIAATDEIALFVRDLIVNKRVSDWEASELIQGIGKNTDEPSTEVIEAYIKMLERPRIQQSRILLADLGIAIGVMIEDSCVEEDDPKAPQLMKKPKQEELPRHPRAIRSSEESEETQKPHKPEDDDDECSPQELQGYIQKIGQKLREAKTINRMLIYIETLAHMGTPKVLPYIKPYVTGEAPNAQALEDEDTDFLATNAVYSLHHIASSYPEEVLPIVTSIYFDPSEDYDQRAAAISVILASDPPLSLLERIATELHDEVNNQVGSYTYSLLSERANSTLPCDRKMAQKIQLILSHAPDFDIGLQYSNSHKYTYYNDDDDHGLSVDQEYISSNVSWIPRAFRTAVDLIRGPFSANFLEIGGTIKGIEELLDKILEPSGILTQMLSRLGSNVQIRNIPQVIDIVKSRLLFESQDIDIPRAALYYKVFGRAGFLTLDEKYVVELLEQAVTWLRQIDTTSGFNANYVKVWMPASFVRVVPSIVGLPVAVSQRSPIVFTFSVGNARVSSSPQKEAPLTSTFALSTSIDASFHKNSISLAYVVDPANDEVHGAALEKTVEIAFAKEIEVVVDLLKETYALSIKPKLPHEIFYHQTRPSTFIGQASVIREPKAEWLGQVNEIETVPEPFKFDKRHECRALGLSLRVVGDSESPWADIPLSLTDTAKTEGLFAAYIERVVNPEMINRELHVYLEPHRKNPTAEILFTADFDKHLKLGLPVPEEEESSSSEEDEEYEKAVSSIYGRSHSVPDAQSTIEKLVKKTQATWAPVLGQGYEDPVPATVTHVLDLTMAVKGAQTKHHALRLMYAHSLGFRSNWFQAVAHHSGDERERPRQYCASLVAVYPEMPNPFYVQMNTLKSQSAKFEGEIGWGTDCQHQSQIKIQGSMEKSEQQLTTSSGMYESEKDQQSLPWYYKQCQVDKTEGKTQSSACEQAISQDSQLNVIKVDVIAPHLSPKLLNLTYKLDLMAKYYLYPNLEVNSFVSNPEDRVSIELHYSEQVPDIPLVNVRVEKPSETLVFSKLYAPLYEPPSTLDSYEEVFMDQFYGDNYFPECQLMEDYLSTLDNVTIELPDNHCQYILAHDNSPDKAYTIIASQVDLQAKTKALSMVLAGHSIKVLPPRGEVVPIVLDGKQHEIVPSKPIVLDFDKETELRIFVRLTSASTETPILVVQAPDDDIIVKYDGKNALIKIPRDFQGDQVGLCGNFNDEQFQEFRGPHGCIYVDEEDFANSYAVPGQSCTKPPQPRGPAFCPAEVDQHRKHKESEETSEEKHSTRHRPKPQESEESTETRIPRWQVPERPRPKHPHSESEEDSEPAPPRGRSPHHRKPQRDSDEDDDDDKKPQGPEDCVKVYTPTYEDHEGKTCFGTQPAYKCRPECRAVHPTEHKMPFHCLPPSKYEKVLKEQAKQGLVNQIQNKPVEKTRPVMIPEKCM